MVRSDVFISYSRKDGEFVKSLDQALKAQQKDVWVDWEDIPFSAKWWEEITQAIEGSTAFICVLSPEYLSSETCLAELKHADECNKRIIPVVCKEFDTKQSNALSVSKINWISFCGNADFNQRFNDLLETLNKDLDWLKFHTRLLIRANEWASRKNDSSYHLYGRDLEEAQTLLKTADKKDPSLTTLQRNYVQASEGGAMQLQRRQLRGFYVAALIYSIAQMFVIYVWNFDSISETGMIKLSWVWLPGLAFSLAGFTIGRRSLKKSIIAALIASLAFFLFYAGLWDSL